MATDETETTVLDKIDGLLAAVKSICSTVNQMVLQAVGPGELASPNIAARKFATVSASEVTALAATSSGLTLTGSQRS